MATERLRNAFTVKSFADLAGREHHVVTAPKRGSGRRMAMQAILLILQRAEQHQHRVSFVLTFGDYTRIELGPPRGYNAAQTLSQCCVKGDPYVWFQDQLLGRYSMTGPGTIIGVEINTSLGDDALR